MRPLTDDLMFQQYQTLGLQRDGGGRTLATASGPTQLQSSFRTRHPTAIRLREAGFLVVRCREPAAALAAPAAPPSTERLWEPAGALGLGQLRRDRQGGGKWLREGPESGAGHLQVSRRTGAVRR